ncbi:MAG: CAP domain-containing protein [Clostridia bacterium]|nr:CAP domain-containing protein [Clostridia bacterium]MDR3644433.1 CAP domain-containing protein [Clostridia bacterium]
MKTGFRKSVAAFVFCCIFTLSIAAQAVTYVVKSGDTMWKIATKYQISVSQLQKANPQIKDASKLKAGQKLTIPNASSVTTMESQVVTLVNQQRAKHGLQQLKVNSTLSYVARLKSQDMINKKYFGHTSPTYGSPFTMMQHYGIRFSAAGENIAMGQRTAQQVMTDWMNSPGHRANILGAMYTQIGVGCAKSSNGTLYWTQEFIKPM